MKAKLMSAVAVIGIALVSMPIAFVLTIMLVPFWSWLETESGFESLGHSGPATWCYLITYMLVASAGGWVWVLQRKKTH